MQREPKTAARRPGRPAQKEAAEHRVEIRRRKASTTMRVPDREIVLFEKLAAKWGLTLPQAFEQLVNKAANRARVYVSPDSSADMGWS